MWVVISHNDANKTLKKINQPNVYCIAHHDLDKCAAEVEKKQSNRPAMPTWTALKTKANDFKSHAIIYICVDRITNRNRSAHRLSAREFIPRWNSSEKTQFSYLAYLLTNLLTYLLLLVCTAVVSVNDLVFYSSCVCVCVWTKQNRLCQRDSVYNYSP